MEIFTLKEVIGWSIGTFLGGASLGLSIGFVVGKFFVKPKIQKQDPKKQFLLNDTCQVPCIDNRGYIDIQRYMFGDECKTIVCYYLENKTECKIKKEYSPDNTKKCDYL